MRQPRSLFHFGELLVAECLGVLLDRSAQVPCTLIDPNSETGISEHKNLFELVRTNLKVQTSDVLLTDVELDLVIDKYSADAESRVDCAIINSKSNLAFPIEVKMGVTGQAKNWTNFFNHNLDNDSAVCTQDQNKNLLKGRIPSFLSRKTKETGSTSSTLSQSLQKMQIQGSRHPNPCNFDSWGLCILKEGFRKSIAKAASDKKVGFNAPIVVFEFKELIEPFKDDKNTFNQIVARLTRPIDFDTIMKPD